MRYRLVFFVLLISSCSAYGMQFCQQPNQQSTLQNQSKKIYLTRSQERYEQLKHEEQLKQEQQHLLLFNTLMSSSYSQSRSLKEWNIRFSALVQASQLEYRVDPLMQEVRKSVGWCLVGNTKNKFH